MNKRTTMTTASNTKNQGRAGPAILNGSTHDTPVSPDHPPHSDAPILVRWDRTGLSVRQTPRQATLALTLDEIEPPHPANHVKSIPIHDRKDTDRYPLPSTRKLP